MELLILPLICGIISLIFLSILAKKITKEKVGNEKMKEIANAISEGAMAFLKKEYKYLSIFIIVLFIFLLMYDEFKRVCEVFSVN